MKKPLFLLCPSSVSKKKTLGFTPGRLYKVLETSPGRHAIKGRAFFINNDHGNRMAVYEKKSEYIDYNDWGLIDRNHIVAGIVAGIAVLGAAAWLAVLIINNLKP